MKTILLKIWQFLSQKNHLLGTIAILIILILGCIVYFQRQSNKKLKDKYQSEVNLNNAIHDSIHIYQNKEKEWVAEKLTLQTTLQNLENNYGKLNETQKELLRRIKEVEKDNKVIAAAIIKTNVKIDSLKPSKVNIDTTKKEISFSDSTKNIKYDIVAKYVLPAFPNVKPVLNFKTFELPNTQFVDFYWKDNKKSGYPIAFSVTNTNDYFKTYDISSYAIPEIKKDNLNPTGWQKFTKWVGKNSKTLITIGVAGAAGAGIVLLTQ